MRRKVDSEKEWMMRRMRRIGRGEEEWREEEEGEKRGRDGGSVTERVMERGR